MEQGTSNCSLQDCGMFTVDCVVVCCCPPCLLLQVTLYICIRLPRRVAVKSKRFMLRKLRKRPKKDKGAIMIKRDMKGNGLGGSWWLQAEDREIDVRSSRSPLLVMDAEKSIEEKIILVLKKEKGIENWMSCLDLEGEAVDQAKAQGERRVWEELVVQEGLLWFGSFWGIPG